MPSTDIWLFDFKKESYELDNPINITSKPGYDNQPYFNPEGTRLLYSSEVSGQTEIFEIDIASMKSVQKTRTQTSEYSPQYRGKDLIVLMVEKDSMQRVWANPGTRSAKRLTGNNKEQIGYYLFNTSSSMITFILGEPALLKKYEKKKNDSLFQASAILSDSIGRCMKMIPGSNDFTFTRKRGSSVSLYRFDVAKKKAEFWMTLPSEDYEWIDSDLIISSDGSQILYKSVKTGKEWSSMNILQRISLTGITRLVYNSKTGKLAVVAKEE